MNNVYFDKKQIENGLHMELINFLIKQSYSDQDGVEFYNDIRIKPEDLGAIVVEWGSVDWEHKFNSNRWEWIDEDHHVMKEVIFPDNHSEMLFDEEEEDAFKQWLELHPNYHKNEWGMWVEHKDGE